MKISIGKDKLLKALQMVFSVVPQKPTLPVLTNFLIKAENGSLQVCGTDMDISITTSVVCDVEEEGSVTVDAKRFLNIIRELPEDDIKITVDNERVSVYYKQGRASIVGMNTKDYPSLKNSLEGIEINLSGAEFVGMVDKTGFSVATERTRVALTGVYWKVSADETVMVSTDGHHLSMLNKKETGVKYDGVTEAIIPPKALVQATRIITDVSETIKVVFGDKAVLFDVGTTTIFSKLIEGPYPNFMQVIPTKNSKIVNVSRFEFTAAVKRVSVLSSSITHQIRMSISSGLMELSTTNSDGGESRESLNIDYEGEPMSTGLNSMFLLEILKKIDSDEVTLELDSPTSASILKPKDKKENEELLYLIMPLRLND